MACELIAATEALLTAGERALVGFFTSMSSDVACLMFEPIESPRTQGTFVRSWYARLVNRGLLTRLGRRCFLCRSHLTIAAPHEKNCGVIYWPASGEQKATGSDGTTPNRANFFYFSFNVRHRARLCRSWCVVSDQYWVPLAISPKRRRSRHYLRYTRAECCQTAFTFLAMRALTCPPRHSTSAFRSI